MITSRRATWVQQLPLHLLPKSGSYLSLSRILLVGRVHLAPLVGFRNSHMLVPNEIMSIHTLSLMMAMKSNCLPPRFGAGSVFADCAHIPRTVQIEAILRCIGHDRSSTRRTVVFRLLFGH